MRSKNKPSMTRAESEHVAAVKMLPCSVCGAAGPSDAHEPVQGLWWISIALCRDCHMGSENGIHGRKTMWRIHKVDEWSALNACIKNLLTSNTE